MPVPVFQQRQGTSIFIRFFSDFSVVRGRRLELLRLSTHAPQLCATIKSQIQCLDLGLARTEQTLENTNLSVRKLDLNETNQFCILNKQNEQKALWSMPIVFQENFSRGDGSKWGENGFYN
jgi:hypothetical protein